MKRRFMAAAALTMLLLTGAACSDEKGGSGSADPTPTSTATGSPRASGASGAPGVTDDDKQICVDTEQIVADATKKFGEEIVKVAQSGANAQSGVDAIKTLFAEWSTGLLIQSEKATNPELKAALKQYADGLQKLDDQIKTAADLQKLQDLNTPEIEDATEKVAKICG